MQLELMTYHDKEVIDITDKINGMLEGSGLINIFVNHATAAVAMINLDLNTGNDLINAILTMNPGRKDNQASDQKSFPEYFWSTIIGSSLTAPFKDGKLILGKSQRIVFIELNGPRARGLTLTIIR